MAFTQPCYIRKNTPELRKKLEELGYRPSYPIFQYPEVFKNIAACSFFGSKYYGVSDNEASRPGDINDAINKGGMIDCGTNEELFLALAALRDDSDYMQWFVNENGYFEICFNDKVENYLCGHGVRKYRQIDETYHKATVKEIVEHFKDK